MANMAEINKKLDHLIETNDQEHEEIMRVLTGGINGKIGLIEKTRNHEKILTEHSKEIDYIKNNYNRRRNDNITKWSMLPLYQKIVIITGLVVFVKANEVIRLIEMLINWAKH